MFLNRVASLIAVHSLPCRRPVLGAPAAVHWPGLDHLLSPQDTLLLYSDRSSECYLMALLVILCRVPPKERSPVPDSPIHSSFDNLIDAAAVTGKETGTGVTHNVAKETARTGGAQTAEYKSRKKRKTK